MRLCTAVQGYPCAELWVSCLRYQMEISMRPIPGHPLFMLRIHSKTGIQHVTATGDDVDAVADEAELVGKKLGQRVDALATIMLGSYIPPAIEVIL